MGTALWTELLNSNRKDYLGTGVTRDDLDDPQWVTRYLSRGGLKVPAGSRDALVKALRRLRLMLQETAVAIVSERRVRPERLAPLNALLAATPLVRRLDVKDGKMGVRLEPEAWTVQAAMAEIVSSFAHTVSAGDASRIKICGNDDCKWFFYDESRNKTRRWCEPTCGNLMKVRRFREKHRAASQ